MTKTFCDGCKKEIEDKNFKFEGMVREVKQSLVNGATRPQLVEKLIHLCKKCYDDKLDI